jgi:hypothetical protein
MDPKQIGKRVLNLNKKAFENSCLAMSTIQAQSEKVFTAFMEQSPWFPKEANDLVTDRINAYKQWCNQFKTTADDHFKKMEDYFSVNEGGKTKSGK